MSDPVEQLREAIEENRISEALTLLKDNPGLNVNFDLGGGWSYLHTASFSGHAEVMKVLLAYSDINVNVKDNTGSTPVSCGCRFGRLSVVKLLLKDPRVDLTFSDDLGRTAHRKMDTLKFLFQFHQLGVNQCVESNLSFTKSIFLLFYRTKKVLFLIIFSSLN